LLVSLNILAFLVHTVLEWFDQCYVLIRNELASRKTFFDDMRALTRYMRLDNWPKINGIYDGRIRNSDARNMRNPKLRIAVLQVTVN